MFRKVNIYLNIFEKKLCFITYLYEKVTINNFLILKVMIYRIFLVSYMNILKVSF